MPNGQSLEYAAKTIDSTQWAIAGRTLLTPIIDLKRYRFTATVDWIEIAFETPGIHQAVNISSRMEKRLGVWPRVSGRVREEDRYMGSSFLMKLQSPAPEDFWWVCDEIERHYHVRKIGRGAISVSGVEVALDIYPKSAREDERQLMTEVVRRHFLPDDYYWWEQRRWPRSFYLTGRDPIWPINEPPRHQREHAEANSQGGATAEHFRDLCLESYRQPPIDGTFYAGEREGELLIRIQDKVTDTCDVRVGSRVELVPKERRTRIELQVGYGAFVGSGAMYRRGHPFRFVDIMNDQFQLFLPSLDPDDAGTRANEWEVFRRAGVLGLDRFQRALLKDERLNSRRTGKVAGHRRRGAKGRALAWSEFNKRGRDELAHLDERWKKKR